MPAVAMALRRGLNAAGPFGDGPQDVSRPDRHHDISSLDYNKFTQDLIASLER